MGFAPFGASPALVLQAATGVGGYPVQAVSQLSIISWTAPADGNLHRVLLMAGKQVTTLEVGGAVSLFVQSPGDGAAASYSVFAGTQAAGDYAGTALFLPVKAGSTVNFKQTSNLTSGASLVWAELWAS